ncbi:MAG TPA: hypothetical protein VMD98_04070 [Bryocella sp.]|nr:hypothetical protein [Bryocella sp.]
MPKLSRVIKDRLYDEREAAAALGVTIARLHEVLDQHIFTDGNLRPQALQFNTNDLLLLGYWCNSPLPHEREHTVITMPKRK